MKATITFRQNDTQEGGLFNKTTVTKYHVAAEVQLSEEEQAIVGQARLGNVVIWEHDVPLKHGLEPLHVTFDIDKCLTQGIHDAFDTPIKAREFAAKLKNDTLPSLKNYIEGNRPLDTEPMVIEL